MLNTQCTKQKELQKGHRQRLLSRLEKNDVDSLYNYEIVEMMLFLIFKRKDTKTTAKILLEKFGSIQNILKAEKDEILSVNGMGIGAYNALKTIDAIFTSILKEKIFNKPVLKCFDDVVAYCQSNMSCLSREELRIIFLNGASHIIGDEIMQKGTVDSVEIYNREVVKRCIKLGAQAIILIHNHPSGDPTPSRNDIFCTNTMVEACNVFNIHVLDHIIIGGNKYTSFKKLSLLK